MWASTETGSENKFLTLLLVIVNNITRRISIIGQMYCNLQVKFAKSYLH